jgi:hypothetical protein
MVYWPYSGAVENNKAKHVQVTSRRQTKAKEETTSSRSDSFLCPRNVGFDLALTEGRTEGIRHSGWILTLDHRQGRSLLIASLLIRQDNE